MSLLCSVIGQEKSVWPIHRDGLHATAMRSSVYLHVFRGGKFAGSILMATMGKNVLNYMY